ncbi:protein kinase [Streptomyces filamentosus]|uniref:protein kinase n=1 Tax=Streptomyces filamentosus TaxID=67294 RepID=UPI003829DBCC
MDEYAGRVLAERYRLPLPPAGGGDLVELVETRAFDTYSGQEVRVRQVPLPEVVDAEVLGEGPAPAGAYGDGATRRPAEPVVRRAMEAAQAAAQIPDHPLLDQVFDVFAEAGSLWIVSEHVAARPLSAFLAEGPLNPFRAAEIAADVLTALRVLHAHGWVHRNITAHTVLVCDDGRVLLTGLAAGAAEEALCGYAPVPDPDAQPPHHEPEERYEPGDPYGAEYDSEDERTGYAEAEYEEHRRHQEHEERREYEAYEEVEAYDAETYEAPVYEPPVYEMPAYEPPAYEPPAYEPEVYDTGVYAAPEDAAPGDAAPEGTVALPAAPEPPEPVPYGVDPYGTATPVPRPASPPEAPAVPPSADLRAARAGAIAAYRAATRAAAARRGDTGPLPAQRPAEPAPDPVPLPEPEPLPGSGSLPGPTPDPGPEPAPVPALPEATRPGPAPQWWTRTADDEDDGDDDEDEDGGEGPYRAPGPPRLMLKGTWSDGPHASRDASPPVPAGGGPVLPGSGRPALPAGYTAAVPERSAGAAVPEQPGPQGERYRGPETRLAAERARQTRIAVVGAVTERWAPEQAGPVHENWRLAPPIGPATDLWALGALLYRAVQGHAPYPEDSAAELVQLVCAEPPAFAEECGPLRPVVESLLRQDPTERPDFEELRGWLRSLVRSAPEPDMDLEAAPPPRFDAKRLPILRRRGELVRRRRRAAAAAGRHRQRRGKEPRRGRTAAPAPAPPPVHEDPPPFVLYEDGHEDGPGYGSGYGHAYGPEPERHAYGPRYEQEPRDEGYAYGHEDAEPEPPRRAPRAPAAPRSRARRVLLVVLLLLGGALAYTAVALPRGEEKPPAATEPTPGEARDTATGTPPAGTPSTPAPTTGKPATTPPPRTTTPPPSATGPALAAGYALREDPEGFRIGVPRDWRRSPVNDAGQVRYTDGDFTLIVVPGRDGVRDHGSDPLEYQSSKERELEPYRQSSWAQLVKARRVDIGRTPTAEGQYTWIDSTGREVFVHNLALIDDGRYYVVQVIGPESDRDKVSEVYGEAVKGFRPGR